MAKYESMKEEKGEGHKGFHMGSGGKKGLHGKSGKLVHGKGKAKGGK